VIGWLGCTPRRLNRYQKLYQEAENLETLAYIPSMISVIFPLLARKASRTMLDQLERQHPNRPLLFHLFSGNGVHFYSHLLRECEASSFSSSQSPPSPPPSKSAPASTSPSFSSSSPSILSRISGCIVDSAPPRFDGETFARGFVGAVTDVLRGSLRKLPFIGKVAATPPRPPSPENSSLPSYTHPILTPIAQLFFGLFLRLPSFRRNFEESRKALLFTQPRQVPQMFLYSKGDMLIPYHHVEEYIQQFRDAGFHVQSVCFPDSPHVSHLLYYPEKYASLIKQFVQYSTAKKKHAVNALSVTALQQHFSAVEAPY